MMFQIKIMVNPKDHNVNRILEAIQEVQRMFILCIFAQLDGFDDSIRRHKLELTFLKFDRVPNQLRTVENARTKMCVSSGRGSSVVFYHVKPDEDGGNSFLSGDGINCDSPSELFHQFVMEFCTVV